MAEADSHRTCIARLAYDHFFNILPLLPVDSILSFSMTCKRFRKLASSDSLWEAICRRDLGNLYVDGLIASQVDGTKRLHWKQLYMRVAQLGSVACIRLTGKDGSSPAPRASHSLNFISNCLVLFGGGCEGGRHLDDTWIADAGDVFQQVIQWQKINSGIPTGRFGQSCNVIGDRLVLFGGINDYGIRQNDTWVCHVVRDEKHGINLSWRLSDVGPTAPSPRGAHAGCCFGEKMLIHGGIGPDGVRLNDTWLLEMRDGGSSGSWHEIVTRMPAPARSGHTLTWVGGDQIILFGGRGRGYEVHNDLWLFDMGGEYPKWVKLAIDSPNSADGVPHPRVGHSAALILGGQLLIYGGEDSQRHRKNDFWVLDPSAAPGVTMRSHEQSLKRLSRKVWKRLQVAGQPPSCRSFHRAACDPCGQRVYISGGMVDGKAQPAEAYGLRFDEELYLVELQL